MSGCIDNATMDAATDAGETNAKPNNDGQGSTNAAPSITASAGAADSVTDQRGNNDHIAAMRTSTAAELRRQAKIRQVTADHPYIPVKATEEGWSSDRAELEVLRASRRASKPTCSGGPWATGSWRGA